MSMINRRPAEQARASRSRAHAGAVFDPLDDEGRDFFAVLVSPDDDAGETRRKFEV